MFDTDNHKKSFIGLLRAYGDLIYLVSASLLVNLHSRMRECHICDSGPAMWP